jgi:hypothetical protein
VRKVTAAGGAVEVTRGSTIAYEGSGGRGSTGKGYFDENHEESVPAFHCVAGCPACGAARLAPAGGEPPVCDCGDLMVWACPVAELDRQSSSAGVHSAGMAAVRGTMNDVASTGYGGGMTPVSFRHGDGDAPGSAASRFFPVFEPFIYAAKASTSEKNEGLDEKNSHATVKSKLLMRRLIRMIVRPGSVVLDCFAGSGSTGVAALEEGMRFIGLEQDPKHVAEGRARCALAERDLAEERSGQIKMFAPLVPAPAASAATASAPPVQGELFR